MTTQFGSTDDLDEYPEGPDPRRRGAALDAVLSLLFWSLFLGGLIGMLVGGATDNRESATFWAVFALIYLNLAVVVDRRIERRSDG